MTTILTLLNSLLYVGALYYYYRKVRVLNVGVFLLILWALSSLLSIYYSTTGIYVWNHEITILPFIYLFVLVLIYFRPILNFRNELISAIWTNDRTVVFVAIIISLIGFLPFIEQLMQSFKVATGMSGSAVAELIESRYGDDTYDQFYYLSSVGRKLNWLNNALAMLAMILFLYLLTKTKKNKLLLLGLGCSIMSVFLQAFNLSARFQIVKNLFLFFFLYIVFYKFYEENFRKKLTRNITIIILVVFIAISVISYFRFSGLLEARSDIYYSIFDWLSLYFSEGFLNFNGDMWYIDDYCLGRNTAYIFRNLFDPSTDIFYRNYYQLEDITHIRMNVFYTMIGDIYSDFGPIGTFFVAIMVSVFFSRLCRIEPSLPLSKIILISLIAKINLIGFTYYTFVGDAIQVVIMPIFSLFLHFQENASKRIFYKKN